MIYSSDRFLALCELWYDNELTDRQSLQLDMIISWLEHGKPDVAPGEMYEIRKQKTEPVPIQFGEEFYGVSDRAIVEEEERFAAKRGRR